jgi:hypothetical protein
MNAQLLKRDDEWVLVTRQYAIRSDGTAVGSPIETVYPLHPGWINFYDRNPEKEGTTIDVEIVQMWKNARFDWSEEIPTDSLEDEILGMSFAEPSSSQYDRQKGRAIVKGALDSLASRSSTKEIAWAAWKASARRTTGWENDTDQQFEENERADFEEFYKGFQ